MVERIVLHHHHDEMFYRRTRNLRRWWWLLLLGDAAGSVSTSASDEACTQQNRAKTPANGSMHTAPGRIQASISILASTPELPDWASRLGLAARTAHELGLSFAGSRA